MELLITDWHNLNGIYIYADVFSIIYYVAILFKIFETNEYIYYI